MSGQEATSFLVKSPGVVEVPTSGLWDGNDGPWSTFDIYVGSPPQSLRVVVSTLTSETWVVTANRTQGSCPTDGSEPNCPEQRGGLFNINASSTWRDQDGGSSYAMDDLYAFLNLDSPFTMNGTGEVGYDTLGLGLPGSTGIKFQSQSLLAYSTDFWYLGSLGVVGASYSGSSTSETSLISSLKDSGSTPSETFAYSAGARYRQNSTATLTFGGYDTSKFSPGTGVSLNLNTSFEDSSGGMFVGLQAITLNDRSNTSLLPYGIQAVIEASIPHIWLPPEACSLFEKTFGIVYNSTFDRYLINETLHQRLQSENASISFILDSNSTETPPANITLPYGSFDLELGPPLFNNTPQRYFPLRRAVNGSQPVLGRTFLQETYLIMDCERLNFSIYPMAWNQNAVSQLVTIEGLTAAQSEQRQPASEFVALVISIVGICGLILGLGLEFRRKERARRNLRGKAPDKPAVWEAYSGKPEMNGEGRVQGELHGDNSPREADNSGFVSEMPVGQLFELEGKAEVAELRGTEGESEKDA